MGVMVISLFGRLIDENGGSLGQLKNSNLLFQEISNLVLLKSDWIMSKVLSKAIGKRILTTMKHVAYQTQEELHVNSTLTLLLFLLLYSDFQTSISAR